MVRDAGLEPARPEWTLEPESRKIRSSAYREVSPRTAKSLDISSFSRPSSLQAQQPRQMQKISSLLDVC